MGATPRRHFEYYRIVSGIITRQVDKGTPNAVPRTTKTGAEIFELQFDDVFGVVENVKYNENPEYGNSWHIFLNEKGNSVVLQIHEGSTFGREFMKKFPLLRRGIWYRFRPYDFTKDNERKVGLNIYDSEGNKIPSYYHEFKKEKDKTVVLPLHGFPEFKGDSKKKTDLKKYFIDVDEFLRESSLKHLATTFNSEPVGNEETDKEDLPF